MLLKHKLDLEKLKLKNGPDEVEAEHVSTRAWKQEDITRMLNEAQDAEEVPSA